jgi:hypothetical protein
MFKFLNVYHYISFIDAKCNVSDLRSSKPIAYPLAYGFPRLTPSDTLSIESVLVSVANLHKLFLSKRIEHFLMHIYLRLDRIFFIFGIFNIFENFFDCPYQLIETPYPLCSEPSPLSTDPLPILFA